MTQLRPISVEGMDKLREELNWLYSEERPRLLIEIADAAAQGDRSENAEYIYGKKRLREIDKRMRQLNEKITNSSIVSGTRRETGTILFGAQVKLKRTDGKVLEVEIVGVDEIDPVAGKISMDSPIGKALMGHADAGTIEVQTPRGPMTYQIESVRYS